MMLSMRVGNEWIKFFFPHLSACLFFFHLFVIADLFVYMHMWSFRGWCKMIKNITIGQRGGLDNISWEGEYVLTNPPTSCSWFDEYLFIYFSCDGFCQLTAFRVDGLNTHTGLLFSNCIMPRHPWLKIIFIANYTCLI